MEQNRVFQQFLYVIIIFFSSSLLLGIGGECLVRLLIPYQFYNPISNIYQVVKSDVGYTYRPNFSGTAFGVPLRTNSLGFRGPEWTLKYEKGSLRIALIGDSHAFGYGVPFEETVGERLAFFVTTLGGKKCEVLNFGVGGYNSHQELAVLRNYALRFDPDIVVVMPSNNDHESVLQADKEGFLRTLGDEALQDRAINRIRVSTSSWLIRKSRLVFYLFFLIKQYELKEELPVSIVDPILEGSSIVSNSWMGEIPLGVIPDLFYSGVYEPLKDMVIETRLRGIPIVMANFNALPGYRRLFAKLSQEENVPSIELLALFPEVNSWEELVVCFGLGWDNHLNAIAHDRWAKAIFEVLYKKGMFESKSQ